jgi:anthranilate phosphoribosyltransferase
MIKEAIKKLVSGRSLSSEEAAQVMQQIMEGEATPAQFGAFVTALRLKGETVDEIVGLTGVMRANAISVETDKPVVDTCGTGGDGTGTFNISTAAAFITAGTGLTVAKHGNRAMSSQCGSADVLEALGVNINLDAEKVAKCLDGVGIGFMFAPMFHPAMKHAAAPRREIGIRTVFNILGPLTNPAGAKSQVLGVSEKPLVEKLAQALRKLGCRHALVVHGEDGLDEITVCDTTNICELKNGEVKSYTTSPEELGISRACLDDIKGGSASENAAMVRDILRGGNGARRDAAVANAAAALLAGDKVGSLKQGVELAVEVIDKGYALEKLEHLVEYSRKPA